MTIRQFISNAREKGLKQAYRDYKAEKWLNTRCWVDTLTYDEVTKRYRLDRVTVLERDKPKDVLLVSNASHHYAIVDIPAPELAEVDGEGFLNLSATSLYLYYCDDSLNKSLASHFKPRAVDPKALILAGIGGGVAVFVILKFMGII